MSEATTSKRRPRAELKKLMLQAGVEVYMDLEPSIGGERVNYANVFRHLEETTGVRVTYGSVHERIWDSQREFQLDVIRTAATQLADHSIIGAENAGELVLAGADLTTLEGKRMAAREVTRMVADTNLEAILDSPLSRIQRAIEFRFAGLNNESPERADLLSALLAGLAASEERYMAMYNSLIDALGLQPRAELFGTDRDAAVRTLTRLGRSVIDGAVILGAMTGPDLVRLPTGPGGALEEWSIAALGAWSVVRSTLELAGDEPAELRRL